MPQCGEGQKDRHTDGRDQLYFASATPHAKCNNRSLLSALQQAIAERENTDGVFVLKSGVPDEHKVEQENDDDRQRQHIQLEIVDDDNVNLQTVITRTHPA